MSMLRVGLVGPGTIGQTHAAAIAEIPGLDLVAVAGGSRAPIEGFPGIACHVGLEEMLVAARPDIVAITSPSGLHFAQAALAVRAGCHVVVEKPLCVDPAEAAILVGLARRAGTVCATISQRRLEPAHAYLHQCLATGVLGTPRLIEADAHWFRSDAYYAERPWRGEVSQGGGSLFNQGIHSLDLMLFLFGPVRGVAGLCATLGHRLPVEDTTTALLAFESGAVGTLVVTTATPPGGPAGLRLFTDRGQCALAQDRTVRWEFPDVPPPPEAGFIPGGGATPGAIGLAGHIAQWRDIADAIRGGRAPAIGFEQGCEAVRVAAAIYRASDEGRFVALAEFADAIDP